MTAAEIMAEDKKYIMRTYGRLPVVLTEGKGCRVKDIDGKEYLDLVAGIAVNGLGHCPEVVVKAIKEQAETLMHTSNLYYTLPQIKLAKLLVEISGMTKAFFCNSGAEANEAAMKLARKATKVAGHPEKTVIITAEKSFHGRTLAAITATGQPKYQKMFTPLPPDYKYVPFNDVEALKAAVDEKTCAVMLEPVQGESGVHPGTAEYFKTARELCDKFGCALIFDEVQTGLGRTGKLFGFENFGVKPDIMSLAKTLAGGFPMGAMLAAGKYAEVFEPGDHASTFGGNPLAAAAAFATVSEIAKPGFMDEVTKKGDYFRAELAKTEGVKEARGLGFMIGIELEKPDARAYAEEFLNKGFIVNPIGDSIIRLVPPLILSKAEIDEFVGAAKNIIK
ncbi:MAG: acetylornithine transaminase [Abditibacteriota bacterium]|nr:acetylornithine transaminase [Abditibacteriota bacterium]